MIKHPAQELKTTDDYRKTIVQGLFNQMLTARFSELSRQASPPFIEGSANIGTFMGGTSVFDASVNAKPGELENGFKAIWRETERLKRFGFTETELERTKIAYLNSVESALKERNKTPSESYVKEYQVNFLKGIAAPGMEKEYQLTKNNLPGITLADLNTLVRNYITATDRDILILAPEKDKASLPNEATINSWMADVEKENLQPYRDEVSKETLLTREPVPGKIKGAEKNEKLGFTTLTLSNGVKVLLKPTDFKNDEIQFSAFAPGGTSVVSDADFQSAANAAGIIPAGGVGNYNLTQLDKYLEGKQLSVRPYIAERFEGISGGAAPKDLETALQLIYAYFTEPRKDTSTFKGIIERSKAGLVNRGNDPKSVFNDTVSAVLGNHNIRRTGPTLEKLSQVDLDKAYAIYKARFADASNFTFTFVGSIDTLTIKPLLEKYLGSLPSTGRHEEAKELGIHAPEGVIEKSVYKGSEPQSTVILLYSGKFDYSQQNQVKMDALKETLEIRLLERLREEEGGVYSPGVYINTSKYPQSRYSFIIQFGCAPQNVDKLIASTKDEINKLSIAGPPRENVDKWRAEEKATFGPQLKTNSFWLGYLNGQLQNKENLDQVNSFVQQLDATSPADVKEMAVKYLNGSNYIRLVLLPEKKDSRQE